jgi:hypothetical protein
MARDDWRIRVELEEEHGNGFLERLGLDLGSESRELANELREHRLAATRDEDTVYVYASSQAQAESARKVVEAELAEAGIKARELHVERWLADDDRWSDEAPGPDVDEELVAQGYAPWEVRVECSSHDEADALADRLESEGYEPVRRWRYVIVGTETREEAESLAARLHGEVEPGSELVWEVMPQNPFAVFGGLGG